jgi:hypothetical protein
MVHRHDLFLHACAMSRRPQKKSKGPDAVPAQAGGIRDEWLRSQVHRLPQAREEENRPRKNAARSASYDTVPDSEDPIEQFSDPVQVKVSHDRCTVCTSPQIPDFVDGTPYSIPSRKSTTRPSLLAALPHFSQPGMPQRKY